MDSNKKAEQRHQTFLLKQRKDAERGQSHIMKRYLEQFSPRLLTAEVSPRQSQNQNPIHSTNFDQKHPPNTSNYLIDNTHDHHHHGSSNINNQFSFQKRQHPNTNQGTRSQNNNRNRRQNHNPHHQAGQEQKQSRTLPTKKWNRRNTHHGMGTALAEGSRNVHGDEFTLAPLLNESLTHRAPPAVFHHAAHMRASTQTALTADQSASKHNHLQTFQEQQKLYSQKFQRTAGGPAARPQARSLSKGLNGPPTKFFTARNTLVSNANKASLRDQLISITDCDHSQVQNHHDHHLNTTKTKINQLYHQKQQRVTSYLPQRKNYQGGGGISPRDSHKQTATNNTTSIFSNQNNSNQSSQPDLLIKMLQVRNKTEGVFLMAETLPFEQLHQNITINSHEKIEMISHENNGSVEHGREQDVESENFNMRSRLENTRSQLANSKQSRQPANETPYSLYMHENSTQQNGQNVGDTEVHGNPKEQNEQIVKQIVEKPILQPKIVKKSKYAHFATAVAEFPPPRHVPQYNYTQIQPFLAPKVKYRDFKRVLGQGSRNKSIVKEDCLKTYPDEILTQRGSQSLSVMQQQPQNSQEIQHKESTGEVNTLRHATHIQNNFHQAHHYLHQDNQTFASVTKADTSDEQNKHLDHQRQQQFGQMGQDFTAMGCAQTSSQRNVNIYDVSKNFNQQALSVSPQKPPLRTLNPIRAALNPITKAREDGPPKIQMKPDSQQIQDGDTIISNDQQDPLMLSFAKESSKKPNQNNAYDSSGIQGGICSTNQQQSHQIRHPSTNTLLKDFVPISGSYTLIQAERKNSESFNNQGALKGQQKQQQQASGEVISASNGHGHQGSLHSTSLIKKITKVIEVSQPFGGPSAGNQSSYEDGSPNTTVHIPTQHQPNQHHNDTLGQVIEIQAAQTDLKDETTQEQWRPGTREHEEDTGGQKIDQEGCPSFARLVNGMEESSTFVQAQDGSPSTRGAGAFYASSSTGNTPKNGQPQHVVSFPSKIQIRASSEAIDPASLKLTAQNDSGIFSNIRVQTHDGQTMFDPVVSQFVENGPEMHNPTQKGSPRSRNLNSQRTSMGDKELIVNKGEKRQSNFIKNTYFSIRRQRQKQHHIVSRQQRSLEKKQQSIEMQKQTKYQSNPGSTATGVGGASFSTTFGKRNNHGRSPKSSPRQQYNKNMANLHDQNQIQIVPHQDLGDQSKVQQSSLITSQLQSSANRSKKKQVGQNGSVGGGGNRAQEFVVLRIGGSGLAQDSTGTNNAKQVMIEDQDNQQVSLTLKIGEEQNPNKAQIQQNDILKQQKSKIIDQFDKQVYQRDILQQQDPLIQTSVHTQNQNGKSLEDLKQSSVALDTNDLDLSIPDPYFFALNVESPQFKHYPVQKQNSGNQQVVADDIEQDSIYEQSHYQTQELKGTESRSTEENQRDDQKSTSIQSSQNPFNYIDFMPPDHIKVLATNNNQTSYQSKGKGAPFKSQQRSIQRPVQKPERQILRQNLNKDLVLQQQFKQAPLIEMQEAERRQFAYARLPMAIDPSIFMENKNSSDTTQSPRKPLSRPAAVDEANLLSKNGGLTIVANKVKTGGQPYFNIQEQIDIKLGRIKDKVKPKNSDVQIVLNSFTLQQSEQQQVNQQTMAIQSALLSQNSPMNNAVVQHPIKIAIQSRGNSRGQIGNQEGETITEDHVTQNKEKESEGAGGRTPAVQSEVKVQQNDSPSAQKKKSGEKSPFRNNDNRFAASRPMIQTQSDGLEQGTQADFQPLDGRRTSTEVYNKFLGDIRKSTFIDQTNTSYNQESNTFGQYSVAEVQAIARMNNLPAFEKLSGRSAHAKDPKLQNMATNKNVDLTQQMTNGGVRNTTNISKFSQKVQPANQQSLAMHAPKLREKTITPLKLSNQNETSILKDFATDTLGLNDLKPLKNSNNEAQRINDTEEDTPVDENDSEGRATNHFESTHSLKVNQQNTSTVNTNGQQLLKNSKGITTSPNMVDSSRLQQVQATIFGYHSRERPPPIDSNNHNQSYRPKIPRLNLPDATKQTKPQSNRKGQQGGIQNYNQQPFTNQNSPRVVRLSFSNMQFNQERKTKEINQNLAVSLTPRQVVDSSLENQQAKMIKKQKVEGMQVVQRQLQLQQQIQHKNNGTAKNNSSWRQNLLVANNNQHQLFETTSRNVKQIHQHATHSPRNDSQNNIISAAQPAAQSYPSQDFSPGLTHTSIRVSDIVDVRKLPSKYINNLHNEQSLQQHLHQNPQQF